MAGRRLQRRDQRGAALLVFLVLLVMGALAYLVDHLKPEDAAAQRARRTQEALSQARDALIGYALDYRDVQAAKDVDSVGADDRTMYGYLPWPDLGSSRNNNIDPKCLDGGGQPLEGCDANTFTGVVFDINGIGPTVVGRFPWRTLGTPPLRDGNGECLWLIVSALHGRIQRSVPPPVLPPMNWDTPGQLDIVVANGTNALSSVLAGVHDRPVAIIFSPGPPLPGQDRSLSAGDDVRQCGGNYDARNYLDPFTTTALGGITNYLAGTNAASGATGDSNPANDPDTPKVMLSEGELFALGGNFVPTACSGASCDLLANDRGLRLTSDQLFGALRNNANFRIDLNSLLERIVNCLRDGIAAGGSISNGKVAGADNNACYGENVHPLGYYPHWREMIFVATPATVNGVPCAGAVLFASQRGPGQVRASPADKASAANYLEGTNLTGFLAATNSFSGPDLFDRVSPTGQTAHQDIVRCIPAGGSLNEVISPPLAALGGQIVDYDPGGRVLNLGRIYTITDAVRNANAHAFFGCSWTPESHPLGSGSRSYFKFNIQDSGEGFTFAIIDADRNGNNVCGASHQHLGYSGNNTLTPPLAAPKLGVEFDTAKQKDGYSEGGDGRSDPDFKGGHAAIVYWGTAGDGNDDNVHGLPTPPDSSPRPVPRNPIAPQDEEGDDINGPAIGRLDANSVANLIGKNIHVRIDIGLVNADLANHRKTYRIDVWIVKGDSDANIIAALQNTARPLASLYPGIDSAAFLHLHDEPTLYDIPGGSCSADADCLAGQSCALAEQRCYAPALRNVRLGFTTSQSSASKDQLITLSDFVTTWLP